MIKTCSVLVLASLLTPLGDEELDKSAAKAADWTSYTFTVTTKTEGTAKGDGTTTSVVKVAKGSPWLIKSGDTEAVREGDSLATKQSDGTWKRYEAPAAPEGKKGKKKKKGEEQAGNGMGSLLAIKAPQDFLKGFGAKLKEVKREDGEGGRTYTGELTAEAAREFGSTGMPKPGGKGPEVTYSGSAKVSVNVKTGEIAKVEIATEAKASFGGKDYDIKRTSTYDISEIGTTKVEIAEEAKKALSN